ncbi:MAG: EAL domain-containing protein, partial [Roseburia sp.]|nr:EAL domain-containing protein [Roseburia sp.]
EKYRIPPRYLYLELTESVFSDVETVILRTVESLHKVGFTILMDDFGSGYSSLNVLKNVQLDVLKIDMKFMSKGGEDKRGSKIIEAVIKMAESLKMPVIAEGVEEKQQVEMLKALGCDYIQGYYFSKPIPMEEYRKLIHEQA